MRHALADTRGLRPPSIRPDHLAAPWRRSAPWDGPPPWGEGFGIPNRSPDPLVRRAGRDHPFPRERDSERASERERGTVFLGVPFQPYHCVHGVKRARSLDVFILHAAFFPPLKRRPLATQPSTRSCCPSPPSEAVSLCPIVF